MTEEVFIKVFLSKLYPFVIGVKLIKEKTALTSYVDVNVSYSKLVKAYPQVEFVGPDLYNFNKGERFYYLGSLLNPNQIDYSGKYNSFMSLRSMMDRDIGHFHKMKLIPDDIKIKSKYLALEQYIVYK